MNIWFNGGIGDFIAVESHLDELEKNNIKKVYLACLHHEEISSLISKVFPNVDTIIDTKQFQELPSYLNMKNYMKVIDSIKKKSIDDYNLIDFSFDKIFKEINSRKRTFKGSRLINQSKDREKYICICPNSNKTFKNRDLTSKELNFLNIYFNKKNLKAFLLTKEPFESEFESVYGLDIFEAIDFITSASGFIGIDSFGATIASQIKMNPFLVKCVNKNTWDRNKKIYFAPNNNFSFLKREINLVKLL